MSAGRIAAAAASAALVLACAAPALARTAADGGSGTYTGAGSTYGFDLLNSGTTPWQYFYLVGPAGTTFVGGATVGEITARCAAGQPDGQANEIECGPLSAAGLQPNLHVAFVATLGASPACAAPFQLDVSPTGLAPFTRVSDVTFAGTCGAPAPTAVAPPVVHGSARVGRSLSVSAPAWSPAPTRIAYQWQRCTASRCRAIRGATGARLELVAADAGHSVRVVATATFGSARLSSVSRQIAVRPAA